MVDGRQLGRLVMVAVALLALLNQGSCGSSSSVAIQPTPADKTATPTVRATGSGRTTPSRTPTRRRTATRTSGDALATRAPGSSRTPAQATRTPSAGTRDCCEEHQGSGCANRVCETCACNVDSFCCSVGGGGIWDATCVDIAKSDCANRCLCD